MSLNILGHQVGISKNTNNNSKLATVGKGAGIGAVAGAALGGVSVLKTIKGKLTEDQFVKQFVDTTISMCENYEPSAAEIDMLKDNYSVYSENFSSAMKSVAPKTILLSTVATAVVGAGIGLAVNGIKNHFAKKNAEKAQQA